MEVILIAAVVGLIPAAIASSKGHSMFLWWFFGFALFIVALPCSFFLKNKTGKKCSKCAEYVDVEAVICKHCRSELV